MSHPVDLSCTTFFDDFTAPELDRSAWSVRVTGMTVNDEQQAYVDSPQTISISPRSLPDAHGVLVIQPRFCPGFLTPEGRRFDFISGRIDTREKVRFTYGTVEARIMLCEGPGLWPAFWALGDEAQWPDSGEIDIMENVGEPDWVSAALHGPGYSGETALTNRLYFPPGDDAARWHTYSVDWSPQGLVFRVDGRMLYRVSRAMVEFHGPWAYDSEKYLILNFALGGTFPFKTNGVHHPYRGLPQGTVRSIRAGEARMLVDWVKITPSRL
jgi:beta-glucanase (GH16 family)